jgi:hypothetical protein
MICQNTIVHKLPSKGVRNYYDYSSMRRIIRGFADVGLQAMQGGDFPTWSTLLDMTFETFGAGHVGKAA